MALAVRECQSHKVHTAAGQSRYRRKTSSKRVTGGLRMKLVPLEDRVVVKVLEEEEKTTSGIVLPDTAKEKPQKATVLAVGPGRYDGDDLIPIDLKEGDVVIFSKYGGTEIKVDGEDVLILRASDILAKLKD